MTILSFLGVSSLLVDRGGTITTFDGRRSGNGPFGAVPYLNSFESSVVLSFGGDEDMDASTLSGPPDPVEPTSVTALKFDGDDGPLIVLSVSVSRLFDVAILVDGIAR